MVIKGVDTADVGEAEVHQGDVGTMLAELTDGIVAGGSLRDQQRICLVFNDGGDALAKQRMIVDAQHVDGGWLTH